MSIPNGNNSVTYYLELKLQAFIIMQKTAKSVAKNANNYILIAK
jgi:hypothetical protein